MAKVVQPDRWQFGETAEPMEPVGEVVRVQRPPVDTGEDVAGVPPLLSGGEAFKALPAGVLTQDLDGVPVQCDDAAAGGALRRADVDQPACAGDLLDDRGGAVLKVNVAPAKPDGLAAPQATQSDEPPQGVEPVGGDPVQERREMVGGPDRDLLPSAVLLPLLDAFVGPDDGVRSGPAGEFDPAGGG